MYSRTCNDHARSLDDCSLTRPTLHDYAIARTHEAQASLGKERDQMSERVYSCLICGKPVPDYKPEFCCDVISLARIECGCEGLPIYPCVCSEECDRAIFSNIGKSYDERREIAGIEKWKPEEKKSSEDSFNTWIDNLGWRRATEQDCRVFCRYKISERACWEFGLLANYISHSKQYLVIYSHHGIAAFVRLAFYCEVLESKPEGSPSE